MRVRWSPDLCLSLQPWHHEKCTKSKSCPLFEPALRARKSALRTRSQLLAARRQRVLKLVDWLRIQAVMARAKVVGQPPVAAAIKGHDVGSNTVQQIKAELA